MPEIGDDILPRVEWIWLTGLDLALPHGATTVLLGRNGSGKTTLLSTLIGLLRPIAGGMRVLGLDPLRKSAEVLERVGFVPDRPDAWPAMRLGEAAALSRAHQPRWDEQRFMQMLARFEVLPTMRFREMSRGQGMKASIALALATDPELLLLDEPFGGLDPAARDEVLDAMIGALGERPRTVFVSTHETEIAARIGEHVVVLKDGRAAPVRPMEEIVHAAEGPRGAAALGALLTSAPEETTS